MKFPIIIYRELGDAYGIPLPDCREFVSGVRIRTESVQEDDYLYLSPELPPQFINEALAMTEYCREWISGLDAALLNGEPAQKLLDISEAYLQEPLFLVDPSMKRIAAAAQTETEDIFFREIMEKGYPSLDTYERLEHGNFYNPLFYTGKRVHLMTDGTPSRDVALQGIRLNGKLAATALMLVQNGSWSEGKAALFSILTERLAKCLESSQGQTDERGEQYDFLLRDLLNGKTLQPEEIAARLTYCKRENPCPCRAFLFTLGESSPAKLSYLCRLLGGVYPESRPIIRENAVFVLLASREKKSDDGLSRLQEICRNAEAFCGISSCVSSMNLLSDAYEQAKDSLDLGRRLSGKGSWYSESGGEETKRCFYHDEMAAYRTIREFLQKHDPDSLLRSEFLDLCEQNAENRTEDMRILYYFLEAHQNYTEAARQLFMHRNSVFYRVERICARMGVEEIGPSLEQGLRFSYMVQDVLTIS